MRRFISIGLVIAAVLLIGSAVASAAVLYSADVTIINTSTTDYTNQTLEAEISGETLVDNGFVADMRQVAIEDANGDVVPYAARGDADPWRVFFPSIEKQKLLPYTMSIDTTNQVDQFSLINCSATAPDDDSLDPTTDTLTLEAEFDCQSLSGDDEITSSASDGYNYCYGTLYNTVWTAAVATSVHYTGTTASLGQFNDGSYYGIQRAYLYFDTSDIPDTAVIHSAVVSIYGGTDLSDTDFDITIQNGMPDYPHSTLEIADYDKSLYAGSGGTLSTVGYNTAGYNDITLNATGEGWINLGGVTKFCLRSSRDISGTAPGVSTNEYVCFFTSESAAERRPKITISWTDETKVLYKTDAYGIYLDSTDSDKITGFVKDSGGATTTLTADNPGGNHAVKLTYDGTDAKLYLDDVEEDSTNCPGYNIHSGEDILVGKTHTYIMGAKITIDGTVTGHWAGETNDTIVEDLSNSDNDATIDSYGVDSPTGVTITVGELAPESEAVSPGSDDDDTVGMVSGAPTQPDSMYREGTGVNLPMGELFNDLATNANIPLDLFWFPLAFGLAVLAGLMSYEFSRSLMVVAIASGVIMVFFSMSGVIPFWTIIIYAIIAAGCLVSEKVISL